MEVEKCKYEPDQSSTSPTDGGICSEDNRGGSAGGLRCVGLRRGSIRSINRATFVNHSSTRTPIVSCVRNSLVCHNNNAVRLPLHLLFNYLKTRTLQPTQSVLIRPHEGRGYSLALPHSIPSSVINTPTTSYQYSSQRGRSLNVPLTSAESNSSPKSNLLPQPQSTPRREGIGD